MKYLVETPHTKEECIRELDAIMSKGSDVLNKFYWGCAKGDHTGYALIDANNEGEAKNLVPDFIKGKAKVIELKQFSADDIRSLH